jgi:hypothetical protein
MFYFKNDGVLLSKTFDHILPKSKGGTDEKQNLIRCCHMCNGLKSSRDLKGFIDFLKVMKPTSFYSAKKIDTMIENAYLLLN